MRLVSVAALLAVMSLMAPSALAQDLSKGEHLEILDAARNIYDRFGMASQFDANRGDYEAELKKFSATIARCGDRCWVIPAPYADSTVDIYLRGQQYFLDEELGWPKPRTKHYYHWKVEPADRDYLVRSRWLIIPRDATGGSDILNDPETAWFLLVAIEMKFKVPKGKFFLTSTRHGNRNVVLWISSSNRIVRGDAPSEFGGKHQFGKLVSLR